MHDELGKRCGGESGIRTHGGLRLAGFQDRFLQPLGHLSTGEKIGPTAGHLKIILYQLPVCQPSFSFFFRRCRRSFCQNCPNPPGKEPSGFSSDFFILGVAFSETVCYYNWADFKQQFPGVAQLVARLTGGQEAVSSSLATRTMWRSSAFRTVLSKSRASSLLEPWFDWVFKTVKITVAEKNKKIKIKIFAGHCFLDTRFFISLVSFLFRRDLRSELGICRPASDGAVHRCKIGRNRPRSFGNQPRRNDMTCWSCLSFWASPSGGGFTLSWPATGYSLKWLMVLIIEVACRNINYFVRRPTQTI